MQRLLAALLLILPLLTACVQIPDGITPVSNFELERYLGRWYEIARLDHRFERDMQQVTADYSMREDGGVRVLNRGFNTKTQEWDDAEGRAYFVQDEHTGFLKVSFFGPFFGSYVVTELEPENYEYALISGPDRSYLWILARTPQLPQYTLAALIARAKELGFDTDALILVNNDQLAIAE